jgi:hypothetical protein
VSIRRIGRALPRWATELVIIIGGGIGLAACTSSGVSLARSACVHIDRSITLYKQASSESDSTRSAELTQQAYIQLRDALPLAARAAGKDAQWQALMTTVSESSLVPEPDLISALTDQCVVANQSNPFQPPPPSSIPAPATVPPPATVPGNSSTG